MTATERSDIARCDPQFPQSARDFVRSALEGFGRDEAIETTDLLVSEVVTYALVAGDFDHAWVEVSLDDDVLRIEVTDPTSFFAAVVSDLPLAHKLRAGGIGLLLVDQSARGWGVDPAGDGTTVWFELDLNTLDQPAGRAAGSPIGTA